MYAFYCANTCSPYQRKHLKYTLLGKSLHHMIASYSKYLILYVDVTGFLWPKDVRMCAHVDPRTSLFACVGVCV